MNKQNKYVLVYWPEIQNYMDHPRYKECYMCESLDEDSDEVSTYMVPEDLYEEVEFNSYPEVEYYQGMPFYTKRREYSKGDLVLFENENGYKWVSKCLATGQGTLPDVFEHSEVPGLGSWIIGTREEKLTEEELKEVIPPEVEMALISLCRDGAIESYNSIKESEAGIVLKEIKKLYKECPDYIIMDSLKIYIQK